MAQIELSGIGVTGVSGKLGGTVFSRNNGGAGVRIKTKGTNPRTNAQTTQRAKFSNQASSWRDLTDAERLSWNLAAASGEYNSKNRVGATITPSGSVLYNRLNNTIVAAGGTPITTPPLKVGFTAITLGALTAASGTPALSLVFTGSLATDERLIVEATYGTSPGVSRPSNFRKITNYSGTSPANLLSAYAAVFGNPIEGTKIFVRVTIVNRTTGQSELVGQVVAVVAA